MSIFIKLREPYDIYIQDTCDLDYGREYIPKQFDTYMSDMISTINDGVLHRDKGSFHEYSFSKMNIKRPTHIKHHGCVRGIFTVDERISPRFRYGIFSNSSKSFNAWIRFSNGAHKIQSDSKGDIRGMAVKLMGVDGKKLLDEEYTQDFLMISSNIFMINEIDSYSLFLKAVTSTNSMLMFTYVFPSFYPWTWRFNFIYNVLKLQWEGSLINNPLTSSYYSATPYHIGRSNEIGTAVKYSLRPCTHDSQRYELDENSKYGDDYLRESMRRHLDPSIPYFSNNDTICYEFLIQEQTHPCLTPVEDSSIPWTGSWVRVATLKIEKQKFLYRDQNKFCENINFNPWHTTNNHRPLGK
jgi:hypothetical protein